MGQIENVVVSTPNGTAFAGSLTYEGVPVSYTLNIATMNASLGSDRGINPQDSDVIVKQLTQYIAVISNTNNKP